MTVPSSLETIQAAIADRKNRGEEYSHFEAAGPIDLPPGSGIRAFNEGDRVPKSHIDSGVVSPDQVRAVAPSPDESGPSSPVPTAEAKGKDKS